MKKEKQKRPAARDDPHEYLGGDLAGAAIAAASASSSSKTLPANVIDFTLDEQSKPSTKKERNEDRKKQNKIWKASLRLPDSGVDANPRHTLYYQAQLPQLAEPEEWQLFQASLCKKLPVTFRFGHTACTAVRRGVDRLLRGTYNHLSGEVAELGGSVVRGDFVKDIAYFGSAGGLRVYELASIDSASLALLPQLKRLSDFLLREVALGTVVRQEVVSMVPVELADIQAHHRVLDVCAAPGSKTEQLLHALHRVSTCGTAPTGFVVANDADPVRIQTLCRRYARSGSPSLLVTCCRAEELRARLGDGIFDRIVCDVPCSGDGTFRKMPHLWRLFRPRVALELHLLQLQIAAASAHMLRPGGRMVYSTCSINPLEDEAVVAGLLTMFAGSLYLVDVRARHPHLLSGLRTRGGLRDWHCDADIFTVGEPDEESRAESRRRLPPPSKSMSPPSDNSSLHLERCLRVLPHDNNTGGFFIAVLEKVEEGSAQGGARALAAPVSELAALNTLRSLGYNPKSAGAGAGLGARLLDGDAYAHAVLALRLDGSKVASSSSVCSNGLRLTASASEIAPAEESQQQQKSSKKPRTDSSASGSSGGVVKQSNSDRLLWGSKKDGWKRAAAAPPSSSHEVSALAASTDVGVVSARMAEVLDDWSAKGVVVQAGVKIASTAASPGAPLRACSDGLLPLSACVLQEAILPLPLQSFLVLCSDEDAYFEIETGSGDDDGDESVDFPLSRALKDHWRRSGQPAGPYSLVVQLAAGDERRIGGGGGEEGAKQRLSKKQRRDMKKGKAPAAAHTSIAAATEEEGQQQCLQGVAYPAPVLLLEVALCANGVLAVAVADPADRRHSLLQALA